MCLPSKVAAVLIPVYRTVPDTPCSSHLVFPWQDAWALIFIILEQTTSCHWTVSHLLLLHPLSPSSLWHLPLFIGLFSLRVHANYQLCLCLLFSFIFFFSPEYFGISHSHWNCISQICKYVLAAPAYAFANVWMHWNHKPSTDLVTCEGSTMIYK